MKKRFGNSNGTVQSDLSVLLNICNVTDTAFQTHNVSYNLFESPYLQQNKFMEFEINGIQTGIPPNLERTKEDVRKRNEIFRINDAHRRNLVQFIIQHKYIFNGTGVGMDTVIKYISLREDIRLLWNDLIIDVKNSGDTKTMSFTDLRILMNPHRLYMNELGIDYVKGAVLLSRPYNIHKKIISSAFSYMSLYNPHIDTITIVPSNDTFVDQMFRQNYIMNLNEKLDRKTISILLNIDLNDRPHGNHG